MFVVDADLICFGRALGLLGGDEFQTMGDGALADVIPQETLDPQWIPTVGDNQWVVITCDRGIRTGPTEAPLAISHQLKAVHLYNMGHRDPWDQATLLLAKWPAIEAFVNQHPIGPWWLSVRKVGPPFEMRYEPGKQEPFMKIRNTSGHPAG